MYWAVILSKTLPEPIFQKITGPSVFMTLIPLLTPPPQEFLLAMHSSE